MNTPQTPSSQPPDGIPPVPDAQPGEPSTAATGGQTAIGGQATIGTAEQPAPQLPPPAGAPSPVPGTVPPPRPPLAVAPAKPDKPFARGFGAGFGAALGVGAVLVALALVSTLGMLGVALIGSRNQSDSLTTTHVWGPENAKNTLLALNINGTIEGEGSGTSFSAATYGYEIADELDALEADDYAGVVLLMDTPGGTIYGARAIADAVVRYQERTGNKVVAYVQSMAASGGMYAMAPADLIIADHGTFTGSIGVIMGPITVYHDVTATTGTILESGVETSGGITSEYLTQGTGKDFGSPWRDMTEQERAVYTQGMAVEYQAFVDFVSEHRDIPASTIVDDLGAFMFDPDTAVTKGLVDEVMGRSEAFREAASTSGVDPDDTRIVAPSMPGALAQLLGAQARVPGHNVPLSTGEGLTPTSSLCTGAPAVLAFSGDASQVCG
ncbi:S49 family peptidase [Brooklawnia cerclae]|uniref:Protease-4 n=1 Tax=Brooklawnia cerclae TaxID=349934 RepID=A0ABX0SDT5_9ACTN|nr:protease-4 [Brooklawnia cerclae]